MGKLGEGIKSFGIAAGLTFGAAELVGLLKESFNAFAEAEENAKRLKLAVGVNGGLASAYKELMEQSQELQKTTIFSDDDIQKADAMALQFGLTTKQVKELLPVITDFATATGQELNGALEAVLRGVEGNGKGLKLYGIEVSATATKAENLANITRQLNERFKGQAEILGNTTTGEIKKLKNAYDDLLEDAGGVMQKIGNGIAKAWYALTDIKKYIQINLAEGTAKAMEEQSKKDLLFQQGIAEQLTSASTKWIQTREKQLLDQRKKFTEATTNEEKRRNALTLEVVEGLLKERNLLEEQNTKKSEDKKTEIVKKKAEDRGKIELEEDLKNLEHYFNEQKLALMKSYAEGKISEETYQNGLNEIQKQHLITKIFNLKQYGQDTVEVEQALTEITIKENDKRLARFKAQVKEQKTELLQAQEALQILFMTGVSTTGETIEQLIARINKLLSETGKGKPAQDMVKNFTELARQISSVWSNIGKAKANSDAALLANEKKHQEQSEKILKEQLDKKVITQAQYDKKIQEDKDKIEKRQRKMAHDEAIRNKEQGIFQATIDTAAAVAGQLKMEPVGPWNIALAAAMGVAGLAEIEAISQADVPELGKGKMFTGIGKHPLSTAMVMDPKGGLSTVEEGEVLLSSDTREKNPIVDALLDASLNNNGRMDSSHPALTKQFEAVNSSRISETSRILRSSLPGSILGDYPGGSLDGYGVKNKTGASESSLNMQALLKANYELLMSLQENGVQASLDYVKFNRDKKRLDTITGTKSN